MPLEPGFCMVCGSSEIVPRQPRCSRKPPAQGSLPRNSTSLFAMNAVLDVPRASESHFDGTWRQRAEGTAMVLPRLHVVFTGVSGSKLTSSRRSPGTGVPPFVAKLSRQKPSRDCMEVVRRALGESTWPRDGTPERGRFALASRVGAKPVHSWPPPSGVLALSVSKKWRRHRRRRIRRDRERDVEDAISAALAGTLEASKGRDREGEDTRGLTPEQIEEKLGEGRRRKRARE